MCSWEHLPDFVAWGWEMLLIVHVVITSRTGTCPSDGRGCKDRDSSLRRNAGSVFSLMCLLCLLAAAWRL